jgi:hypothetical protein
MDNTDAGQKQKRLIVAAIAVFLVVAGMLYFWLKEQQKVPPVRSFIGIVEQVENNAVIVTSETEPKQTRRFAITSQTTINRLPSDVQYLFNNTDAATPTRVSIDAIKVGDRVTISTTDDLRLKKNEYVADYVNLPALASNFTGTIVSVSGNRIVVKGPQAQQVVVPYIAMGLSQPEDELYQVTITGTTEISYIPSATNPNQVPKPVRLQLNQLQTNMKVRVYTAVDASVKKEVEALRVEPLITAQ